MVSFKQFSGAARVSYLEGDLFEVKFTSPITREMYTTEVSGEDVIADLRGSFQDDETEPPATSLPSDPGGWKTRLSDPRFRAVVLRYAWQEIMPELESEEEEVEEEDFYEEEDDWEE